MQMIDTAEVVAKRYGIAREAQDEYGLQSQQRTAAAQAAGRFNEELAPLKTVKAVKDKETGEIHEEEVEEEEEEGLLEAAAAEPEVVGEESSEEDGE